MFILSKKLKILKDKLKIWNKDCFGNVHNHVISAEQKLHQIQIQIQHNGHTEALLNEEKLASAQYEDALNRQEVYWKEKARVNWHLEGDRNTKYFHRIAKIKSSTKFINSLQDGKPKASYLQPIADKIKLKLSAWKASLLSIAGRVQLVRSVIQSMLTYSISLYSWPASLLNIEKCVRNFIWSGDIDKRKLVTTSWKKICRPLSQGGLNLRSLSKLNKATNLKLCWNLFNSQTSWAILLRDRVFRKGKTIRHHIFSSIWSSIKDELAVIMENTIWLLGNGEEINFWNDNWCGAPLADQFNIPFQTSHLLSSTVSDYILNGQWNIPPQLSQAFDNLTSIVHQVIIPMDQSQDKLLWKHTDSGDLELKEAYQFKMQQYQDLQCLNLVLQFTSMEDIWKLCDLNWSPQCKVTLTAAIINLLNTIWLVRNQARYNNAVISWKSAISMIIVDTSLTGNNTSKLSSNAIKDFIFLKMFRITIHHPKVPVIKEIYWQPPLLNWIKCNIDGASCGNPGNASCGGIFRNHEADFIYGFAEPLGVASSVFAELCGAMRAIEIAYQKNWRSLWLESDSTIVVSTFNNPSKPVSWALRNRWKNVLFMISQMNCIVTHIFREGNQVADLMANHGKCVKKRKVVSFSVIAQKITKSEEERVSDHESTLLEQTHNKKLATTFIEDPEVKKTIKLETNEETT
ncbi:unnamed protein product [Trifolium pratense]|uniref:Uncharacterized protein n=1 Tax=Trifolium pratense TaxID=57577 RepID=A0ACB0LR30_TRIPR|nr:unnamed protein product [Trifolium pratense]